jgi:type I restriction enzyme S subunit
MITKQKTVPELRFPGFEGAWGVAALGQIADIKLGKMLDKEKQTSGHLLPYLNNISLRWNEVDTSNLPRMYFRDNELDRFGLRSGDVVVCEGGEPGRSALWDGRLPDLKFQKAIHRVRFNVPFEQRLLVLYLEKIAGTTKFEMLFTGGGIKHLTRETFSLLQIPMISLPEQRKIAEFLTAVDGRIGQLSQKKALLEDYKKGVMQQLFTQALRFKDDHGNDFPKWEEKRLGELCATFKSGKGITSEEIEEDGKYPVYGGNGCRGYTNTFTHDGEFMLIGRQGALCGNINRVSGKSYISEHAIAVAGNELANTEWLAQRLHHLNLNRLSESSAQPGLAVNKLERLKISTPSLPEQTKIANFLTALDRKIESVAHQITHTQTFKKGLLQQMFV